MANLLHSLPDGNSKWRPTAQPIKVDPEDTCPSPEDSSFSSSCDSINEENAFVNNISTRALESTAINHRFNLQKSNRFQQAISVLCTFLSLFVFKTRIISIQLRLKTLKNIRLNQAARKITQLFRRFIQFKKNFSAGLFEKFKDHCAVLIQKHFRGYLVRKNFQEFLMCREERLKALILAWKTRRVMRNPEVVLLRLRILAGRPAREEFISKVQNYLQGNWVPKLKSPQSRRILYKNSTRILKTHERKLSEQDLNDSIPKEATKHVKFSLKNHESPKTNEPDLKSVPQKSILKVKTNPEEVDWEKLQEKLDRLFEESEGRVSMDDRAYSLLFKNKPRIKKKEKKLEMKDWVLEDFEVVCEDDCFLRSDYKYLVGVTVIPRLTPSSKFFEVLDVNTLYSKLKKEYNSLRNL